MKKTMVRTLSLLLAILMIGSVVVLSANAADVTSISVQTFPTKRDYLAGEKFDSNGLVLNVSYNDGSSKSVLGSDSGVKFTGFDSSEDQIGNRQTITVTYGEQSATFQVAICMVESISIKSMPTKKTYEKGEKFDPAGMVLNVYYSSVAFSNPKTVTDTSAFKFSGFNSKKTGTQSVTVNYMNKETTFNVNIIGVESIAIKKKPTKLDYKVGENFDPTGMVLEVTYTGDEAPKTITSGFTCSFNSTSTGEKTVTVTYGGKSTTLKVNVTAYVKSVSVGDVKMLFKTTAVLAPAIEAEPGVKKDNLTILYESADPSIARVDDNGKVTAVSWGETTITVTVIDGANNNKIHQDTCKVTVRFTILQWIFRSLFGWIQNWK